MRARRLILTCLVATSAPAPAASQLPGVGRIERVAQVLGGSEPVQIRAASDRVQLRRGATGPWLLVGPDSELVESDHLRVRRYVDVRLRVERPTQRGQLVFLTELLGPMGGRPFQVGNVGAQSDYVLGDTAAVAGAAAADELVVTVESGGLVVHWSAGRLAVIAAGVRTIITGTRVAFALDATGDNGLVYLDEGSISFPDFPTVTVDEGDEVRLTRGLPPVVTTPPASTASAYSEAVRYNGEQVWAQLRPFWLKPSFYVPALATVAGTTTWLLLRPDDGPGAIRGTVIVRIPFR
jgi:hypothetical protein